MSKKTAKKKAVTRAAPAKKAAAPGSLERRAARDPYTGPSSKRIEQSLDKGTSVTLQSFRDIIDWP